MKVVYYYRGRTGSAGFLQMCIRDRSNTSASPGMSRSGCSGWTDAVFPCWTSMAIRNRTQSSSAGRREMCIRDRYSILFFW